MAMVRVGTKLYDQNQMFSVDLDSVAGPVQMNAAQLASMYNNTNSYTMGNTTQAGQLQGFTPEAPPPKPKAAPAPAPAPAPRKKKSVLSPTAPPPAPLDQKVTQKERNEVTKPAKGLESTIKTTPTLLRERRRRSYLTAGA